MTHVYFWGLLAGLGTLLAYLRHAHVHKAKPDPVAGIHNFLAAASFIGALKIILFAGWMTFDDSPLTKSLADGPIGIHGEDALFIALGGIALGWASLQQLAENFNRLKSTSPAEPISQH